MWIQHRLSTKGYLVQLAIVLLFASAMRAESGKAPLNLITEAEVADLLNRTGLHVEPSQVHLPTRLVAKSSSPELKLISVQRLGKDQVLVFLRCEAAGNCLPFNATVEVSSVDAFSALKRNLAQPLAANSIGRQSLGEQSNRSMSFPSLQPSEQNRVTLGSQVTLVIRDGNMDIHLAAVAMDSGSAGAHIRVRTANRQKSFRAVVLDDRTVIGAAE